MTWLRSRQNVAHDVEDTDKADDAEQRAADLEYKATLAEAVLRAVLAARHGDPWTAPIMTTIHRPRRPNV